MIYLKYLDKFLIKENKIRTVHGVILANYWNIWMFLQVPKCSISYRETKCRETKCKFLCHTIFTFNSYKNNQ